MLDKKVFLLLFSILGVLGLLLIGDGMTGRAISDPYVKELCQADADCKYPEYCCHFKDQTSGVCNSQERCAEISTLSNRNLEVQTIQKNKEVQNFYNGEAYLGALILLLTIGYFYVYVKAHMIKPKAHS